MYTVTIKGENVVEKRHVLNEIMWSDRMTMQSLKFLSLYLSKINARDLKTRKVRFSVKDFAKVMDFKGNFNREHYKATVNRLLGHVIHKDLENGGLDSFQLFQKCRLDQYENGDWFVEMNANDDALPLMFEFKDRYFTYKLWNVLHLKSYNHLRMYEILKQYEKSGERIVKLDELKDLLNIEQTEYQQWYDFKKRVLESCKKALTQKTDIKFSYEPIRNGRGGKVTGVKFIIEENKNFDGQITFDEFVGYTSEPEQIEYDQLTFEDFNESTVPLIGDEADDVIIVDKNPPKKSEKKIKKEPFYGDLKPFAEICELKFTVNQMKELYDILHNAVVLPSGTPNQQDALRKHYLRNSYVELLWREDGAEKGLCEKVNNRFRYLKGILEIKLRERTLEK